MLETELPKKISVFPLSNAIFFPRTVLPLNIFEKRYIQMVSDSMKENKVFGMVQPKVKRNKNIELYKVGCLGKIISFNETKDNRFIIALSGITRFKILNEVNNDKLYREFIVDYSEYSKDLKKTETIEKNSQKNTLLKKVELLFNKMDCYVELKEFKKLSLDQLINTISMVSPFSVEEKQKLIETIEVEDKFKTLDDIINFNLLETQNTKTIQ
tara:strand:+ start:1019 stop:1657 length:639 start_codon:yes stop_codon:yes gene_type:complete